jgi:hypothetical protein
MSDEPSDEEYLTQAGILGRASLTPAVAILREIWRRAFSAGRASRDTEVAELHEALAEAEKRLAYIDEKLGGLTL